MGREKNHNSSQQQGGKIFWQLDPQARRGGREWREGGRGGHPFMNFETMSSLRKSLFYNFHHEIFTPFLKFYLHFDEHGSNTIKEALPMRTTISEGSLETGMVCHIWAGSRLNACNLLGITLLFMNSWTHFRDACLPKMDKYCRFFLVILRGKSNEFSGKGGAGRHLGGNSQMKVFSIALKPLMWLVTVTGT